MMLVDIGQRITKEELGWIVEAFRIDLQANISIVGITGPCEAVETKELVDRLKHYETQYTYSADNIKIVTTMREEWLKRLDLLAKLETMLEVKQSQ